MMSQVALFRKVVRIPVCTVAQFSRVNADNVLRWADYPRQLEVNFDTFVKQFCACNYTSATLQVNTDSRHCVLTIIVIHKPIADLCARRWGSFSLISDIFHISRI